ncbi:hypothetical protein FGB62_139g136 [Gracilaria domingensis]|nr:hypothetical protein FGB62_139g136 [Gracilaria domingensis]
MVTSTQPATGLAEAAPQHPTRSQGRSQGRSHAQPPEAVVVGSACRTGSRALDRGTSGELPTAAARTIAALWPVNGTLLADAAVFNLLAAWDGFLIDVVIEGEARGAHMADNVERPHGSRPCFVRSRDLRTRASRVNKISPRTWAQKETVRFLTFV